MTVDNTHDRPTEEILHALFGIPAERIRAPEPPNVIRRPGSNNNVTEVRFGDGRSLIVKRAPHAWSARRFRAAKTAAYLLRQRGVEAPEHLPVPEKVGEQPVMTYWRIPLPTLNEVWPTLGGDERSITIESWGALLETAHRVTFDQFGSLPGTGKSHETPGDFLRADLEDRLRPAMKTIWPDGMKALDALSDAVDKIDDAVAGAIPSLLHQDMHMGNVLVRRENGRYRCAGFIDLESAQTGPREADIASALVQHGVLFGLDEPHQDFLRDLTIGYGRPLHPFLLRYYEIYHLVNYGFYSAMTGAERHAEDVARAAELRLAVCRLHNV